MADKTATKQITLLTITSVVVDTESFDTAPAVNGFSTAGLQLIVYLSDGSNVKRDVSHGVTIDDSNVFASMAGAYYITASYKGHTSAQVEILILDADGYIVTGSAYTEGIALWKDKTLQANFLDQGYNYAVGDDNPFKFELLLVHRNKETDQVINKYIAYESVSEVYDMNGNKVDGSIVTIDEKNHTFQFTSAAVGNSYRITTRPKNIKAGAEALFTKELTVQIVDGFNVHEEIELNVLTNVKDRGIGNSGYTQLKVLYNFMKNNVDFARNMTEAEYVNFVDSINGIVIHDFLKPETSHFPNEYFFATDDDTKYLWDHFSMYYREFTAKGTFNFYGNYFQIDTNAIPCVAAPGTINTKENIKSI